MLAPTIIGKTINPLPMSTTDRQWMEAFVDFYSLPQKVRLALRHAASAALVARGAEEVGTSDINHALFEAYNANGKAWNKVALFYVDYIESHCVCSHETPPAPPSDSREAAIHADVYRANETDLDYFLRRRGQLGLEP